MRAWFGQKFIYSLSEYGFFILIFKELQEAVLEPVD